MQAFWKLSWCEKCSGSNGQEKKGFTSREISATTEYALLECPFLNFHQERQVAYVTREHCLSE